MLGIYSVKDRESKTFINPFAMQTDRDAKEGFRQVVNDDKSPYAKFPDDYELLKLGTFDPRSGEIEPHKPETLCWAKDLVNNATL